MPTAWDIQSRSRAKRKHSKASFVHFTICRSTLLQHHPLTRPKGRVKKRKTKKRTTLRETRETVCTLFLYTISGISCTVRESSDYRLLRILFILKDFNGPEDVPREVGQRVRDKGIILYLRQIFVSPFLSDKKRFLYTPKLDNLGIVTFEPNRRVISDDWLMEASPSWLKSRKSNPTWRLTGREKVSHQLHQLKTRHLCLSTQNLGCRIPK